MKGSQAKENDINLWKCCLLVGVTVFLEKWQEHHQLNPLKTNKFECTSQSLPPNSAAAHTEQCVQHDPSTLCFTAE